MSKYALNRTTIVLITSQPSFVLGMLMVVAPTGHALNSVSFASPSAKRECVDFDHSEEHSSGANCKLLRTGQLTK